jgi:hypothetical protein
LDSVDAVGPSPLLVHKPMLAKLAHPWWDLSLQMKRDEEANRVFGWVLEMWGYNLAARNLGIRHTVSQSIQVEPQGVGTDGMADKDVYHYTFSHALSGWKLDKRMYFGGYPPDHMPPPPLCSAKSASVIRDLWTEAAQAIPGWKNRIPEEDYSAILASQAPLAKLAARPRERSGGISVLLVGTGPWGWGKLKGLYFFSRGVAFVQPPESAANAGPAGAAHKAAHGTWSELPGGTLSLRVCGSTYVLAFSDPAAPWAFSATKTAGPGSAGPRASGSLSQPAQKSATMHPLDPALRPGAFGDCAGNPCGTGASNATLVEEVAGSGPWEWAGLAPLGFMRGGELITPWGTGTWGSTRGAGSEVAPADAVFADFANSQHSIRLVDRACLRLGSVRKVGFFFILFLKGGRLRRHRTHASPPSPAPRSIFARHLRQVIPAVPIPASWLLLDSLLLLAQSSTDARSAHAPPLSAKPNPNPKFNSYPNFNPSFNSNPNSNAQVDGEKVSITFSVPEGEYGADEPHTICSGGMMDQAVLAS